MNPKALSLVAEEDPTAQETSDRRHVRKRAKGPASSKMTDSAAGPALSKKRTAPAGTNTSKAAKKCKTGVLACQVRSDKHSYYRRRCEGLVRTDCHHTARYIHKIQMWLQTIQTDIIVREKDFGVYGGLRKFAFRKLGVGNLGKSEQS